MYTYDTCAKIELNYFTGILKEPEVAVENYTDCVIRRPFGVLDNVTYNDLKKMLRGRCSPESRINCKQLLQDADIDYYSPLAIIKKTHGIMSDDFLDSF